MKNFYAFKGKGKKNSSCTKDPNILRFQNQNPKIRDNIRVLKLKKNILEINMVVSRS